MLVVEDEYLLAELLSLELAERGARVVGPVSTVADGMELLEAGETVDAAVVDVNLGGDFAYALADGLRDAHVPFVFTTGYEVAALPSRYAGVPCCQKPYDIDAVIDALRGTMH